MLKYGPIRTTVPQMSREERERLRRQIVTLVAAAEQLG